MSNNDVTLSITADDQASAVVGDVADAVDRLPDETTVTVDADTRDARSNVERLDEQLDALDDDTRELRIEFRAQQLRREIATALRDLDRLDDPVAIETRTTDLSRATEEMRELAELAGRKYDVQIDVDPKRNAARAADDVARIGGGAEALQSGIGPLRGFTDELGEGAGAAGTYANAMIDAGEAVAIFGGALGLDERKLAKYATALSGIGVAAGVAMLAVSQGAKQATARTDDLTESIDELSRVSDELFTDTVVQTWGQMFARAALDGKDLDDQIRELVDSNYVGARRMLEHADAAGLNAEATAALRDAIVEADASRVEQTENEERYAGALGDSTEAADLAARAVELVGDAAVEAGNRSELAIAEVSAEYDRLRGNLSDRSAYLSIGDAFDDLGVAAVEAFAKAEAGADDADAAVRDAEQAQIDLKNAAIDYTEQVEGIPPEKTTEILALIDQGKLAEAENELNELERTREARINVVTVLDAGARRVLDGIGWTTTRTVSPTVAPLTAGRRRAGRRGAVAPTAATPTATATLIVDPTPSSVNNVTVNLPAAADARDVIRAVNRWTRLNGRPADV